MAVLEHTLPGMPSILCTPHCSLVPRLSKRAWEQPTVRAPHFDANQYQNDAQWQLSIDHVHMHNSNMADWFFGMPISLVWTAFHTASNLHANLHGITYCLRTKFCLASLLIAAADCYVIGKLKSYPRSILCLWFVAHIYIIIMDPITKYGRVQWILCNLVASLHNTIRDSLRLA